MKSLLIALSSTFLLGGVAFAEKGDQPTAEQTLLEGLKLIRDGKVDEWISKFCSPDKLCVNDNSKKSLKTYNAPAMGRRAKHCVKEDGTIKISRTDEISPDEFKFFVDCEKTAMAVPFRLGKFNGKWYFNSL
jgi:hypothetical protein